MRYILLALAILFSFNAFACDIRNTGLPQEEVAKLQQLCEQAKLKVSDSATTASNLITTENMSAVGKASMEIAKAIGLAAHELGVAANDFLLTPAGILIAIGVFWKLFLGQTIGIILMIVIFRVAKWLVLRLMTEEESVQEVPGLFGLYKTNKKVVVYKNPTRLTEDHLITLLFTGVGTVILTVWALCGLVL